MPRRLPARSAREQELESIIFFINTIDKDIAAAAAAASSKQFEIPYTERKDTDTDTDQVQDTFNLYKYKGDKQIHTYIIYIHYIYNYLLTHIVKFATVADQFINK